MSENENLERTDFIKIDIQTDLVKAMNQYEIELLENKDDCLFRSFDLWLADRELACLEQIINR